MSFYLKYELSRLLHADGAKTFQAVEKATRRNVLLHLVDKSVSPELVEKIRTVDRGRGDVIEVGEFAGSYYVVTDPVEDFQGLGAWLDRARAGRPAASAPIAPAAPPPRPVERTPPPAPPRTASAPPASGPGEFTKMFGGSPASAVPPPRTDPKPITSPTVVDVAPTPVKRAAPVAEHKPEPGEFTRLFGEASPPAPPPKPAPKPPPPPPTVRDRTSSGPGEMTRLFSEASPPKPPPPRPAPTPAPASRPAPESDDGPGEFTQLFGGGAPAPSPMPTPAPPPPPAPPPRPAASRPAAQEGTQGEFTRLFGGAPKSPAPPAVSGGHSEGSGEFTRLFGGQGSSQSSTSVPRLEPKYPQKEAPVDKSSGEFTRLFGASGKGPAKPKAPEPERPKYKPDPMESPLAAGDDAPGEFTRMFGNSSAAKPPSYGAPPGGRPNSASFGEGLIGEISGEEALSPDQGPKVSKNSKPFRAPGEFTRMFGPSDPSQAPPQDFIPAAQKSEGYASGLFRNPHSEPKAPAAAPARGSVGQGVNTPAPGAYTLMFERKGKGEQNAAAAPAPAAPAPHAAATTPVAAAAKPGKGLLIGLIAAVLVAVVALGAALYLLLNRSSDEPAEGDPQAVEQPAEGSGNN